MNRIRKGDLVVVISGKHKGKTGRILQIMPKDDKVVIEGVNKKKRHIKPNSRLPQGGVDERERPMFSCKIMPVDPETGKATRVRIRVEEDSTKVRVAKSGAVLTTET